MDILETQYTALLRVSVDTGVQEPDSSRLSRRTTVPKFDSQLRHSHCPVTFDSFCVVRTLRAHSIE